MIGCLVLAFALCQTGYSGGYAYSGAYAQSGYYVQPQPVYVVQPQPVYVVQPQVVYAQPYGGGYGYGPFGGGGISVNVGRRGGVGVRCC